MSKPHKRSLAEAEYIVAEINRWQSAGFAMEDARRMDADETNMLAQQLEQMRTRVYEAAYPELKARKFIPVSNEVDPGAETFSFEVSDYAGEAKIISNYADDLPTVETKAEKVTHGIVSVGDAYVYSIQDLRRAAFSGKPLSARKAISARRVWERKLDEIAAEGAPNHGIATGFLNDTNVAITALAAAGTWSTKTAAQMLADLNALSASVITASKELYAPDTLLLPTAQYLLANHTRMSADNPESVLSAFLRSNPWIREVDMWNKLSGAGAGGLHRAVAYAKDPEVLELQVPQEFEVLPPQPKNLAFQVLCHGRTAGTTVTRPLGVKYMDGI